MLPGRPCKDPLWGGDTSRSVAVQTIKDLAALNVQRSRHTLRGVGAIHHDTVTDTFSVGPEYTQDIEDRSPPQFPGPWRTAAERYEHHFDFDLDGIRAGILHTGQREEAFLIHSWMKDAVVAYPPYQEEGDKYVIHEDSNGGHLLVDEEGRITGMIDWER
jgi:hypothetical protein